MRQHDSVVQCARPLQCHIHAQRLAETCQEELNLVRLSDKLIHGPVVMQERQFTNWALDERWLEPFVDQLYEVRPRRQPVIEL
jgi:hypothetical protein